MDTDSSNFTQTNNHDQIVLDEEGVYLDYNATTPLDPEVRKAIKVSINEDWGNPSSGKWLQMLKIDDTSFKFTHIFLLAI